MEGKGRALLRAYGVLNAVLYSLLLPLWEGFDEPFHYAYVAALARAHPPSTLTREIRASLELAPLSHVVTPSLGFGTTYSEWFALPEAERRARREGLQNLPPSLAERSAPNPNYEAHQAPLAYALLALPDRLMGRQPLLHRVVTLRLICALAACLMIIPLTYALARELKLSEPAQHAAVFLVLSSQMFWASSARVANDWLAIPLVTAVLLSLLRSQWLPLGGALAAALLAKSYLLPWALFCGGVLAWRRRGVATAAIVLLGAGPWYARNLWLAGSLSGRPEAAAGIGPSEAARAALQMPWPKILAASGRAALWTGNNNFTSFHSLTLNVILLLIAATLVWWLKSKPSVQEWLVATGCAVYAVALVYAVAQTWVLTHGRAKQIDPWYVQPIAAPVACLVARGAPRWLRAALVAGAAYVLAATYAVKLIPLYSGFPEGSVRVGRLWDWYLHAPHFTLLGQTALGSPAIIWALMAAVVALAVALAARLISGA